jgi:catechol 2,3-dioxygenase-like lactoylglutathione lyase family enzyme
MFDLVHSLTLASNREIICRSFKIILEKEPIMRSIALFIAGIAVGLAVQAIAQNPSQNRGIVGLNHVALSVPNLDEALTYYTKTMGFPEAFRSTDDKGQPTLVYVQISKNTFVELQPANAQRPVGINHFGVHVENMPAAVAMFKQRGANVSDPRVSPTKAILANITDLNGVRIELGELPPESSHRQAMERWK